MSGNESPKPGCRQSDADSGGSQFSRFQLIRLSFLAVSKAYDLISLDCECLVNAALWNHFCSCLRDAHDLCNWAFHHVTGCLAKGPLSYQKLMSKYYVMLCVTVIGIVGKDECVNRIMYLWIYLFIQVFFIIIFT